RPSPLLPTLMRILMRIAEHAERSGARSSLSGLAQQAARHVYEGAHVRGIRARLVHADVGLDAVVEARGDVLVAVQRGEVLVGQALEQDAVDAAAGERGDNREIK